MNHRYHTRTLKYYYYDVDFFINKTAIDVVNTCIQNAEGVKSPSARLVALELYKNEGICAFYRGMMVLLLRAAISNGVTFLVHDVLVAELMS